MEINWYGMSCFRITERKHATIVTDPYASDMGLGELKLKGDVVTVSHNARGHNSPHPSTGMEHFPDGPGE